MAGGLARGLGHSMRVGWGKPIRLHLGTERGKAFVTEMRAAAVGHICGP